MPVNVQLPDSNFSLGPLPGFFYSFNFATKNLRQVEADGDVVALFPASGPLVRNPAKQLHYDGTFFWTLEDLPSNLGIVIKQWRLTPFPTFAFPTAPPTAFTWQDEITLIHGPNIRWQADGFAVEHYHRTLQFPAAKGSTTVTLNSVENLAVGDRLYLGPSSLTGFVGQEELITVTAINSTTKVVSFNKSGGLASGYTASDPADHTKSIFVFNANAFTGSADGQGSLIRLAWPAKNIIFSDQSAVYAGVSAADFDAGILGWVKSSQIFELNLTSPTFGLARSIEANLLEANQNNIIPVHDLILSVGSNVYFKLQQKETTESISTGTFSTNDFTPLFNFQTQTTLPVVNSTGLSFRRGRYTLPFSSGETLAVRAEVRDQFNFPVLAQTVQFTATLNTLSPGGTPGTFSPSSVITNVSGVADTTYTPSTTSNANLLIDIQARVL